MLDKRTFCKFLDNFDILVGGMEELENTLNVTFDNNFLTKHLDTVLDTLGESFFTQEELDDLDTLVSVETVKDLIYHYAFKGEFGLKTGELQRIYVEDEGLPTEFMMNAFNSEQLYDVINRYLNPPEVFQTCLINC